MILWVMDCFLWLQSIFDFVCDACVCMLWLTVIIVFCLCDFYGSILVSCYEFFWSSNFKIEFPTLLQTRYDYL